MKGSGFLAGAALAGGGVALAWATGILDPPESLSRRIAALEAVFPGPVLAADVARIPCPPLRRARLYVVCTDACEGVWRLVAVRGLRALPIGNPGRRPPEPVDTSRERLNAVVAGESLRLDRDAARDLLGCFLRLEGIPEPFVLDRRDARAVEAARGDETATRLLLERFESSDAAGPVLVEEMADGWRATLLYWDAGTPGRPIVRLEFRLAADGQVRAVRASPAPVTPSASESGPGDA